jgi:hypothetical protein
MGFLFHGAQYMLPQTRHLKKKNQQNQDGHSLIFSTKETHEASLGEVGITILLLSVESVPQIVDRML